VRYAPGMTAAHPLDLPMDDLDVAPVDDALLATLSPEERALGDAAREDVERGKARIVWQEDMPAALDEIRRMRAG
jgi:hypothetical protein